MLLVVLFVESLTYVTTLAFCISRWCSVVFVEGVSRCTMAGFQALDDTLPHPPEDDHITHLPYFDHHAISIKSNRVSIILVIHIAIYFVQNPNVNNKLSLAVWRRIFTFKFILVFESMMSVLCI